MGRRNRRSYALGDLSEMKFGESPFMRPSSFAFDALTMRSVNASSDFRNTCEVGKSSATALISRSSSRASVCPSLRR